MRFQTRKVIPREDPQIVLRALAGSLRQITPDVVLDGSRIILHGLGPSPRIINPRDVAILRVQTEDHRTVIDADVTFQPSCLLGESPQDEVVSYKLDLVFDQMKAVIASEMRRKAQPSEPVQPLAAVAETAEALSPFEPIQLAPPTPLITHRFHLASISKREAEDATPSEEAVHTRVLHFNPRRLATGPTLWLPLLAVFAFVALALCFYLTFRKRIVSKPTSSNIGTLADSNKPTSSPAEPSALKSPQANVADPGVWFGNWAAAMRTRDPVVQASFYADPVDNYLGHKNVSNAEIVADKKRAIEQRRGLWTIKFETIVLVHESTTSVNVHLIKHSIAQTGPARISEKFVKCQLRLKRVSGQWKIVSEENL